MNSVNWPALSAPKNDFFGLLRNCLNGDSTAMVTYSFQSSLQFKPSYVHSYLHRGTSGERTGGVGGGGGAMEAHEP